MSRVKLKNIADVKHVIEISQTTGEIIEYDKTVLTEEAVIKQREVIDFKKSQKELHQYIGCNIGGFFFYFYNKIDKVDILPQYKLRFLYMASYLSYESGDLVNKYKGEGNVNIRLDRKKLFDILKLSESEFKKTIKILTDNSLITKDGKFYKINTTYSVKGCNGGVSKGCTRVFIDNIRSLYEATEPRYHKRLYYIFILLPYINLQYNIICSNPSEEMISSINYLTMNDMCDKLGLDKTNKARMYNELRKFRIDDNYVICKTITDNQECIIVNPKLYYSGTRIDDLKYTIGIFDMFKQSSLNKHNE